MAGFDKVKVTVLNSKNEIMIQDETPRPVDYQKFYDDEEFNYWAEAYAYSICHNYPEDVYSIKIDTLDAYGEYKGFLTTSSEIKRSYNFSN